MTSNASIKQYQAWTISAPGELTHRTLRDQPLDPGPHQVLVRIQAVSLNYRDILVKDHNPSYPGNHQKDLIPCSDAAGVIERVGTASRWKVDDRVILHPNNWTSGSDARDIDGSSSFGAESVNGTLTQYKVVDDTRIIACPEYLSTEEGATLITAGLTAYHMLERGLKVLNIVRDIPNKALDLRGLTVVTQGTGGVSCFAIQLASALGATVIATSSSEDKLVFAKQIGATHTINYRQTPEWSRKVLDFTGGKGADIVVEVGGSSTIEQSAKATGIAGVVPVGGVLTLGDKSDLIANLIFGRIAVFGVYGAGSLEMGNRMMQVLTEHQIHPIIAETFDFEQAKEAFAKLEAQSVVGKIVIKC